MPEEPAGYVYFLGPASVFMARQAVRDNRTGRERDSVQYGVSSLSSLTPERALALLRGHREIENRLFQVKDDGFGGDRRVLQHQHIHSGMVMSQMRGVGLMLLRGKCQLQSQREPITGRAQRLAARPAAILPTRTRLWKSPQSAPVRLDNAYTNVYSNISQGKNARFITIKREAGFQHRRPTPVSFKIATDSGGARQYSTNVATGGAPLDHRDPSDPGVHGVTKSPEPPNDRLK